MPHNKTKFFGFIWMAVGIGFVAWVVYTYQPHGVDRSVFQSSPAVQVVSTKDFISFTPTRPYRNVLLFYPGALVAPEAYAPLCRTLADSGCKTILLKMPWRLASQGYNKPIALGLLGDTTRRYVLAGHSQGGKMAARFVYEHPGLASSLVLLGTTHPRDFDLSQSPIRVLKLYGTSDGVANPADVLANRRKLPATAQLVPILGGNHSQFGYYGFQLGDHKATISRQQQQETVVHEILAFIQ